MEGLRVIFNSLKFTVISEEFFFLCVKARRPPRGLSESFYEIWKLIALFVHDRRRVLIVLFKHALEFSPDSS